MLSVFLIVKSVDDPVKDTQHTEMKQHEGKDIENISFIPQSKPALRHATSVVA